MKKFPSRLIMSFFVLSVSLILTSGIFGQTNVQYHGSFTVATLPTSGVSAGDVATVTDSTRGIWQYSGSQWIAKDGRRPNALDFCNPATTSDCTTGLQAAIDALNSLGGGTLVFPAGYTFQFASPLNLVQRRAITFEGTVTKGETGTQNLVYTGAGSSTAFNMLSSYEITFRNINIGYNNSSFTGWLMQTGHDSSGADTQRFLIDNCFIHGYSNASNAAGLVDLNLSIIGKITDSTFQWAHIGIRGITGAPNYAYIYNIDNNAFNYVDTAIYNPDANWRISGNTFSPSYTGTVSGVDTIGDYYIRGLKIEANYFGDASTAVKPMVRLRRCLATTLSNNWFTVPENGVAMDFTECQGIEVSANRLESSGGSTTGVLFNGSLTSGYNYAATVSSNSLNVTTPITGGYIRGKQELSNETGGDALTNFTTFGMTIKGNPGTTPVMADPTTLTIGSLYGGLPHFWCKWSKKVVI